MSDTTVKTVDLDAALSGVSQWRIAQIRRTIVYIEQSIKTALEPLVFEPNNLTTWRAAIEAASHFLHGLWLQGGLLGASSSESYHVACGLGSTMTQDDVEGGLMIVQVAVQIVHPAEFIALTFEQPTQAAA